MTVISGNSGNTGSTGMTGIALTDAEPILTAVAGQRIPRRAWAEAGKVTRLLNDAGQVLNSARSQAELLRRRAYSDGRAAGIAKSQAIATEHLLEAQRKARELLDHSQARIIALAIAIVQRIAPRLDQGELVAALAAQAMSAIREERHLRVRVHPASEIAMRTMLDQWQQAHPQMAVAQLIADSNLDPAGCVIESELGRMEVGLQAQLETVRERLLDAAVSARD